MKRLNQLLAVGLLAVCLATTGCIKGGSGDETQTPPTEQKGSINFNTLNLNFEDGSSQVTSGYHVLVKNSVQEIVADGTLSEMSAMELPAGDYTIEVSSISMKNNPPAADWERPHYLATGSVTIAEGATSTIGTLTAKLQNIGVQIEFTDNFKAKMSADSHVDVLIGLGSLTYTINENRVGYFIATAATQTLTAELVGTLDGQPVKEQRIVRDVKPGDRKLLTYDIKATEPDDKPGTGGDGNEGGDEGGDEGDDKPEPDTDGSMNVEFRVDVTVEEIDIDGNIIVDENDGENEGGNEGGDNEGDDKPEPDTPSDLGAPTILWEGHNLDEWYELTDSEVKVALNITAPNKIKTLVVDIISNASAFQPDQLQGVGLDSHLDLSNPGDLREAIEGLGFPAAENVVGKTELIFDISDFMPLMSVAEDKDVEFRLTLTDEFGHEIIKSLKIKVNLN